MIMTLAPYWTRKLVHLFLDEMVNSESTPKPSLEVRLREGTTLISFHRLPSAGDLYNAENYRVDNTGEAIWVPGDSFFPPHYGPHDLSGWTKQGMEMRGRVVTMLKENNFERAKENVMHLAPISDADYVTLYTRKS